LGGGGGAAAAATGGVATIAIGGAQADHRNRLHLRRISIRLRGAVGELFPHPFSLRRDVCVRVCGSRHPRRLSLTI
jgi:hypothetical protein